MLGQDFLPYMDIVMPPLLRAAQLKPDVNIMSGSDGEDDFEDSNDDEVPALGSGLSPLSSLAMCLHS